MSAAPGCRCDACIPSDHDLGHAVREAVKNAGWVLIAKADYEELLGAYALREIRAGRGTTVPYDPDCRPA